VDALDIIDPLCKFFQTQSLDVTGVYRVEAAIRDLASLKDRQGRAGRGADALVAAVRSKFGLCAPRGRSSASWDVLVEDDRKQFLQALCDNLKSRFPDIQVSLCRGPLTPCGNFCILISITLPLCYAIRSFKIPRALCR
jgi:hypothetical protein